MSSNVPNRCPDDEVAIARLNERFCHALDRGTAADFAALFTEDAIYSNGSRMSQGSEAILAFAMARRDVPRTSRHFMSGLSIDFDREDEQRATGISCCIAYSAAMAPPISSVTPTLIADFADIYRKENDIWLYAERRITPIFTPPTP
jgi:hypothetical protein